MHFCSENAFLQISIHALCEEGDGCSRPGDRYDPISIHALCEEGDTRSGRSSSTTRRFLSTPSARRATCRRGPLPGGSQNFYPRPLRGGRRGTSGPMLLFLDFYPRPLRGGRPLALPIGLHIKIISIHALCEEGDRQRDIIHAAVHQISIHALCEEGDARTRKQHGHPRRFLSTPSARRATWTDQQEWQRSGFLSTPSARRATGYDGSIGLCVEISIHALCEEGDPLS